MILIDKVTGEGVIDLCLDTAKMNKQAIIFLSTKKSAESCAEKISLKLNINEEAIAVAEKAEKVLSPPTKQCLRLGKVLRKGIAFHHAGLNNVQRGIIEENFRSGKIRFICSTTTLGAGLDLPAFRSIIRDLKRFSPGWGSVPIPVLEYEQMSGRAGRPSFDEFGEAICIANTPEEKEIYWEEYINGTPEDITSKLGVEPVLRMYVLSLVSSNYVRTFKGLMDFLSLTFYAYQYKDLNKIKNIIFNVIESLEEFGFITSSQAKNSSFFKSANEDEDFKIEITRLGSRVSDLYLDPLTAHRLIVGMKEAKSIVSSFSVLQLICEANEMRPLIKPRKKEEDMITQKIIEEDDLLCDEPSSFSDYYYEFVSSIKTAMVLEEWMDEKHEHYLFDEYNVTPGELNSKIERGNWLLYSCQELAKIVPEIKRENLKLHIVRERLNKGIKEELLPLVKLKGIGRIRARKLFNNRIKDVKDIKKASIGELIELLGRGLAIDVKKQVGQDFSEEKITTKKNKRKGQINLEDFGK